jgi:integrase
MATIRNRGPYQWQAQVRRLGYPPQSKTFETREAAEKWGRAIERELDQGLYINRTTAEKNTLGDVLARYLSEVVPGHKGSSVEIIRIKAILRASIAKVAMIALSPAMLAEWRDQRLQDVSPATVRRDLDIISAAINTARKDWGINVDNPVLSMRRPKPSKARNRRLVADEEKRLLDALENEERDDHGRLGSGTRNPWIKPLVQLAIETAMRRGELLSLRWEHIDLKQQTAHLPDTKNGEERTVPLSRMAVSILRHMPRDLNGQVFPTTEDAIKKAFSRAMERARRTYVEECKKNKVKPDVRLLDLRFHDLRHEATSRIAEKLENILELSAVTGHKDVRMLKRYYHPKASSLAKKLG